MTSFHYNPLSFFSFASYLGSLFFEAQRDWKISIRKQERDEYLVVVIKCHREIKMRWVDTLDGWRQNQTGSEAEVYTESNNDTAYFEYFVSI